jgi:hypothetical protein
LIHQYLPFCNDRQSSFLPENRQASHQELRGEIMRARPELSNCRPCKLDNRPAATIILPELRMIWHYRCPECGEPLHVIWGQHKNEATCPKCNADHYPSTPSEDHGAYFSDDKWPKELEEAVVALRGTVCSVPGCFREYSKLLHRKPFADGGRTSVENLVPLCAEHAASKGSADYDEWLKTLKPSAGVDTEPDFTFTITKKKDRSQEATQPRPPSGPAFASTGFVHHLAGKGYVPDEHPPGLQLIAAAPFLPGPMRKLVFHYDWKLEHEGSCSVFLTAWPHGKAPDFSKGKAGIGDPKAAKLHKGKAGEQGAGKLELSLPPAGDEIWTAAVFVESEGGRPELTDFLLAGTD